jgi:hypothetical protein
MRISFDFDSTLSEERTQALARKLQTMGAELWIISSRVDEDRWGWNTPVLAVAERLNIPRSRIVYTEGSTKWEHCKENQIDIHFDDDQVEIELLEEHCPECTGVIIFDPDISYNLNDYEKR